MRYISRLPRISHPHDIRHGIPSAFVHVHENRLFCAVNHYELTSLTAVAYRWAISSWTPRWIDRSWYWLWEWQIPKHQSRNLHRGIGPVSQSTRSLLFQYKPTYLIAPQTLSKSQTINHFTQLSLLTILPFPIPTHSLTLRFQLQSFTISQPDPEELKPSPQFWKLCD